MVRVHAARPAFERPDAGRIAAMSGAMALNLAGLALLLIPIVMPSAPPRVEEPRIEVFFPEIEVIKPLPPPPVAPVIPQRPRPVVRQPVVTPTPVTPAVVDPVIAEPWTPPADPVVDATPAEPQAGPIDAGALATVFAPPPNYPVRVIRQGIEGTVMLRIHVGTDGRPLEVRIDRSSGNRDLDKAAVDQVRKKWRFQPKTRDGVPVEAWGRVPIVFSLDRV